jgi:hypothetical protein
MITHTHTHTHTHIHKHTHTHTHTHTHIGTYPQRKRPPLLGSTLVVKLADRPLSAGVISEKHSAS